MGVCIEKIPCPDCGGSDCLQTFYDEEKGTNYGICFGACGLEFKGDPYSSGDVVKAEPKSEEEIQEEITSIKECTIFNPKGAYRGIPSDFFRSWGCRLLVSEYDGKTPYAVGLPYSNMGELVGWKAITMKKKAFFSIGNTKDCDPFGLERALKLGGKKLWITEGEYDAIALDYCLVESQKDGKFPKKMYPVISLTSGGGSIAKNLKKIRKRVKRKFSEVILVLDDDEVGQKAEKDAQAIWPEVLVVTKPSGCKDANDAVKAGKHIEMGNSAYWEACKLPIEGVISVSKVLKKAVEPITYGLSYPYEGLTELTYGQRFSEAVCLGAGVGVGKTVTAHEFMAHNIVAHNMGCFAILLEEQNHDTVRNVCSKIDNTPYTDPNADFDVDKLITTANTLEDKLYMWESDGDQSLRFDMDEIMSAIRFNVMEYGTKFVYLDNFTRLVDHLDPSSANEFINKYSSEIENLAVQLDIHIMCYSHLNPPKVGPSHEEGAPVYAYQFTGSRGIMRSFPMLMSFRRNKHADGEGMSNNNSIIGVIKNRKYGNEGNIKTTYIPNTGRLMQSEWEGELMSKGK